MNRPWIAGEYAIDSTTISSPIPRSVVADGNEVASMEIALGGFRSAIATVGFSVMSDRG